ncbi:Endothelin-converting enzyme 1 [Schistosoma japonicum]|nr:Endothelin-converting enzyme 1 [Schistosoma japonicum]
MSFRNLSKKKKIIILFILIGIVCASIVGALLFLRISQESKVDLVAAIGVVETKNSEYTLQNDTNNSSLPQSISQFQNACDDFDQLACAKWREQNPLLDEDDTKNVFDIADRNIDISLWRIISNDSYSSEDSHLKAARAFYKSCLYSRNLQAARHNYYQLIYKYFGKWELIPSISKEINITTKRKKNIENMSLTALYLPILSQTGRSPLFSLSIDEDTSAINISPGSFFADLNTNPIEFEQDFYEYAFGLGVPKSEQIKLTNAFEMMIRLSRRDTIASILDIFNWKTNITIPELHSICSQINWKRLLKKILQQTGYENYTKLPITIEGRHQLKALCAKYKSEIQTVNGKITLHTLAIMDFIIEHSKDTLELSPSQTADFLNSSSHPHFDDRCMSRLMSTFPWTVEKLYIDLNVNDTHKNEIINIFEELKVTLRNLILNTTWLHANDTESLLDKISTVKLFALYPERNASAIKENASTIYQYPIYEDAYYLNEFHIRTAKHMDTLKSRLFKYNISITRTPTFTADAYYKISENCVYFHAGLLQPPFYSNDGDLPSIYGGIGWLLGHELIHALGIVSTFYHSNGNKTAEMDSVNFSRPIHEELSCMKHQYSAYEYIGNKRLKLATLEEIVADNLGFELAYKTYRRILEKSSFNASQDYNSNLASDRTFFLTLSKCLCGHHGANVLKIHSVMVPHVVEKYRVIGMMSNSEEFSTAYGCSVDSPMNPMKKCKVL